MRLIIWILLALLPGVGNQGATEACGPFSVGWAYTYAVRADHDRGYQIDPWSLYAEYAWAYTGGIEGYTDVVGLVDQINAHPGEYPRRAVLHQIGPVRWHQGYAWDQQIRRTMRRTRLPVVLGFDMHPDFYSGARELDSPAETAPLIGRHNILVIGIVHRHFADGSPWGFRAQDSFGTAWDRHGDVDLSARMVARCAFDAAYVTVR